MAHFAYQDQGFRVRPKVTQAHANAWSMIASAGSYWTGEHLPDRGVFPLVGEIAGVRVGDVECPGSGPLSLFRLEHHLDSNLCDEVMRRMKLSEQPIDGLRIALGICLQHDPAPGPALHRQPHPVDDRFADAGPSRKPKLKIGVCQRIKIVNPAVDGAVGKGLQLQNGLGEYLLQLGYGFGVVRGVDVQRSFRLAVDKDDFEGWMPRADCKRVAFPLDTGLAPGRGRVAFRGLVVRTPNIGGAENAA